jgi:hypothetical protein
MSTTPRTDAAVKVTIGAGFNAVCPNFARTLETELAAMTARAEKAEVELATLHMLFASEKAAKIERGDMYIETLARAEKAEAALQKIKDVMREDSNGKDPMDAVEDIVTAAASQIQARSGSKSPCPRAD